MPATRGEWWHARYKGRVMAKSATRGVEATKSATRGVEATKSATRGVEATKSATRGVEATKNATRSVEATKSVTRFAGGMLATIECGGNKVRVIRITVLQCTDLTGFWNELNEITCAQTRQVFAMFYQRFYNAKT